MVPFGGGALLEGMNEWEGNLSFLEVVADTFAELLFFRHVVEGVVHELEGDAEVHAEIGEGSFTFGRCVAQNSSCLAGGRKKNCRLATDDFDITFFGDVHVAGADQLQDFPFGDDGRCIRKNPQHVQIAVGDHEREGFGKKEITDQH